MIAAVALRPSASILALDADLCLVADLVAIAMDDAVLR